MTPIRRQLRSDSTLLDELKSGLGALKAVDRSRIEEAIKARFGDSLDADAAFLSVAPSENRWDYLLGDEVSKQIYGLEPHSAKQDEVSTVIAKKRRALEHLRRHWRAGSPVVAWFWVASGSVQFPDVDRNMKRLAQEGITFVGKQLQKKHLPKP